MGDDWTTHGERSVECPVQLTFTVRHKLSAKMNCHRQSLLTVGPVQLAILALLTILSELQKTNSNQAEQELLLVVSTELIFEVSIHSRWTINHTERRKHVLIKTRNQNRQLKSVAELSQLIRAKAKHVDRLPLHQLLATINQAINVTSSVDGLYRLLNRALPKNSSPI